jgi:hypothetical protein
MRKTIYAVAFLLLLFFGALAHTQAMTQQPPIQKVPQLVHALKDEGAKLQHWSLYARHQSVVKSPSDFYEKANKLQQEFTTFHWTHIEKTENNHVKISGVRKVPGMDSTERITLFAYPRKSAMSTYLIYELNGESWGEKSWAKFSITLESRLDVLFQKNGKIFACASGIFSDTMDIVISKKTNDILSRFHAHVIEQVEEKTFESVSAYTNEWNDTIKTNGRKMNLQVGLRTIQRGTTVTIGTPIITTEY